MPFDKHVPFLTKALFGSVSIPHIHGKRNFLKFINITIPLTFRPALPRHEATQCGICPFPPACIKRRKSFAFHVQVVESA